MDIIGKVCGYVYMVETKLARIWSDIWKNWLKNTFSAWMSSLNLALKINDNIRCSDNAY